MLFTSNAFIPQDISFYKTSLSRNYSLKPSVHWAHFPVIPTTHCAYLSCSTFMCYDYLFMFMSNMISLLEGRDCVFIYRGYLMHNVSLPAYPKTYIPLLCLMSPYRRSGSVPIICQCFHLCSGSYLLWAFLLITITSLLECCH